MELVQKTVENLPEIIEVVSQVIAAAAILAAVLGKPKHSGFLCDLRRVLDLVALNIKNARNAK